MELVKLMVFMRSNLILFYNENSMNIEILNIFR